MKKIIVFSILFIVLILNFFAFNDSTEFYNICNEFDCEILSSYNDEILVKFSADDYDEILNKLNIEICNKKYVSDRWIVEGFSNKIRNYKKIANKKINVQLAICNGEIILGSPLIKNSF